MKVNILIADDEEDILEILTFLLESSIECTIHQACDGQEAIAQLNQQEIDLVICDYNMPNKNGGDVYRHILNSGTPCKYVMCSTDLPTQHEVFLDRSSFFGFVEKPNIINGIKPIIEKFKEESIFFKHTNIYSYCPIGTKLLLNLSVMPSDVFIKLAEDRYVKVFAKGEVYDETDYIKFDKKGVTKLYVMNISNPEFIDLIQKRIKNISKKTTEENKVDSVMQIHDIFISSVKEYGVQPSFIPLIELQLKTTLELCKTNKSLNLLMNKLLRNKESYLTKHSFLLVEVTIALASKMDWVSNLTAQKLVFSALFHDIYLPLTISNEMVLLKENKNNQEFLSHPQKASELLELMSEIPSDTTKIILEHHEVGEDIGFPKGIGTSKTSPLGQLFIFSHYLVDFILEMHNNGPIEMDEVYQKMETITNKSPKNEKFLLLLKEIALFK